MHVFIATNGTDKHGYVSANPAKLMSAVLSPRMARIDTNDLVIAASQIDGYYHLLSQQKINCLIRAFVAS